MTSNPPVGAKVLMASATITDLLKLPLPVIAEDSGHIRANGTELLEGGAGGGSGDIPALLVCPLIGRGRLENK